VLHGRYHEWLLSGLLVSLELSSWHSCSHCRWRFQSHCFASHPMQRCVLQVPLMWAQGKDSCGNE